MRQDSFCAARNTSLSSTQGAILAISRLICLANLLVANSPTYGRHKYTLPYVGELATNKFARQIRRLIAKIAPCVELRLVFRAAQKLSCLTRLKSTLNVLSRSGVVYRISCTQCEAFYVGKTKRRLEQRVQEHSQQGYSSLYKHSSDLCHQIDYSNPAVISVDNNDYRLQIKEALKIKDLKAYNSLNANIRSCELKLW